MKISLQDLAEICSELRPNCAQTGDTGAPHKIGRGALRCGYFGAVGVSRFSCDLGVIFI